jgi:hypothetical protein
MVRWWDEYEMRKSKGQPAEREYHAQPVQPTLDGFGFNVVGARLKMLVRFSYATEEEAREAWPMVNWAASKALAIVPHS